MYVLIHVYKESLNNINIYKNILKTKPDNIEIVFENTSIIEWKDYLKFIDLVKG